MKFLCRIFGHKWGTFTCLRCGKVKPEWKEIARMALNVVYKLAEFWKEVRELKEKRDREYEEMVEEPETTGQILKRLGVRRERIKRKETPENKFKHPRIIKPTHDKKKRMRRMWKPLLDRLLKGETVRIDKNDYFGKIRGADILREARKDLKRLGYNVEVRLKGHGGTIRIK